MELKKLPIPYLYAILMGIGLAVLFALKRYLGQLYWGEAGYFNWHKDFIVHLVNYTTWAVLLPLVYFLVSEYQIRNSSFFEVFKALSISLMMAIFHEVASNIVYHVPAHFLGFRPFTQKTLNFIIGAFPSAIISRLVEYWILYAILTSLEYRRELRTKQLEYVQLESQLAGAQLNALRLQLQPHFLFNTLNTISSLMEFDIKKSQKIVSQLGSLLRTVLDEHKNKTIPLREELEFVKSYLAIEQARFMDRLNIHYEIDEKSLDALVPSLILQPLVENAIKHGFSNKIESGTITVITQRIYQNVKFSVRDDGKGSNIPTEELLGKGIGLKNAKQRLDLLYKEQYDFSIISGKGKGFEIAITIPYHNQKA